jgi:CBS domain-containing protein
MESHLRTFLDKAKEAASDFDNKVVLCGILPTISKNELDLSYMTPVPRYYALNDRMKELRGGDFEVRLRGVDELTIRHDSVLFEACNTSFQMHLQIDPDDFVKSYNWAQAISGPVLGVCANSPLLLGRELWNETRIALFQQSIDTRSSSYALKDQQARVSFGNDWETGNAADIFKRSLVNYKVILSKKIEKDSLQSLSEGKIPTLEALNLHNGTVYRWNRPCYGSAGNTAHLRIENRYIPSGPSVKDEMANFAFWVGLMKGRPEKYDDLPSCMSFKDVKSNFFKAARSGKATVITWDNELVSIRDLVLDKLLPIAKEGLKKCDISEEQISEYLGIIEARVTGKTGARWQIEQFRSLIDTPMKRDDALVQLTKSIYEHQEKDLSVDRWTVDKVNSEATTAATNIGHIMSTQLFTVRENDLAAFATRIMNWTDKHHIPVENEQGILTGILTWTHMKKFRQHREHDFNCKVGDIMEEKVLSVSPDKSIKEAIALMKQYEYGCLPVVIDDHLVGIVTIKDVLPYDHD